MLARPTRRRTTCRLRRASAARRSSGGAAGAHRRSRSLAALSGHPSGHVSGMALLGGPVALSVQWISRKCPVSSTTTTSDRRTTVSAMGPLGRRSSRSRPKCSGCARSMGVGARRPNGGGRTASCKLLRLHRCPPDWGRAPAEPRSGLGTGRVAQRAAAPRRVPTWTEGGSRAHGLRDLRGRALSRARGGRLR
jgi:hypothetical protein